MEREKPIQLDFVDNAKRLTIDWARSLNIGLHNIETVIPFILDDKELSVWLFFETVELKKKYESDTTIDKVKEKYLTILQESKYPADYLEHVSFVVDTHENVLKNFEGSYFYRLR
jgi:hypothetical protein